MLWLWLSIGIAVIALVAAVLASYFEVRGVHKVEANKQNIHYDIKALFGLVRMRLSVPMINFKGMDEGIEVSTEVDELNVNQEKESNKQITPQKAKESIKLFRQLLKNIDGFSDWLAHSLARIRCEELRWSTAVGTGDAASTAVVTGLIWGLKSSSVAFLAQKIRLQTMPHVHVRPEYNATGFTTELIVIMKIRHVEMIRSACLLLWRIIRVKGGLKVWRRSLLEILK